MAKTNKTPIPVQRDDGHWLREDYRQRMTVKQWKEILLRDEDRIRFHGYTRRLVAKNLGAGVVEITKEALKP